MKAGTLITPTRMALGFTVRFNVDVAINQDLKALYPKDFITTDFINYWFEANRSKIEKLGIGSTVAGIQASELKSQKINVPEKPEQERIVSVLEVWDEYIEKLEQKIALKEQLKRGLIQQLVSNNSHKNKFSRVIEFFDFLPTYSHSKSQMTYSSGDEESVYAIHYGDIHTKFSSYIKIGKSNVPHLLENVSISSVRLLREGDIVVTDASEDYDGVGSSVEILDLGGNRCIAGLHTFALRPKEGLVAKGFGALIFENELIHRSLMKIATYSKVYGITKTAFSQIIISLPSISEQEHIVKILNILSDEIELMAQKRDRLKKQKKYLLKNLITGTIRTPENLALRGDIA